MMLKPAIVIEYYYDQPFIDDAPLIKHQISVDEALLSTS